jgi:hypothetical protein
MSEPNGEVCLWCGKGFTPRRDGGRRQVFCRPVCRRGFDAAGRRWVADAIVTGTLSLDALRNGSAATRALLPGAVSAADDFLVALLDLPGEAWSDLAVALPDEIYDRIDQYLEARLSSQPRS